MRVCTIEGCGKDALVDYSFCKEHIHRAFPCTYEGCPNTIAVYNKSGFCYDHRWVPQKIKRMKARGDI